jgi:hypothetical protein
MDSHGLSDFLHDLQGRVVPENSQYLWYSRECLQPRPPSPRESLTKERTPSLLEQLRVWRNTKRVKSFAAA